MSNTKLNAAAREWRPPATSTSNPDVLLAADFALPPASSTSAVTAPSGGSAMGGGNSFLPPVDPHRAVFVYDEVTGEGVLEDEDFDDGDDNGAAAAAHSRRLHGESNYYGPPGTRVPGLPMPHSTGSDGMVPNSFMMGLGGGDSSTIDNDEYAEHLAQLQSMMHAHVFGAESGGTPFIPTIPGSERSEPGVEIDWEAELKKFLKTQQEVIIRQVEEQRIREGGEPLPPAAATSASTTTTSAEQQGGGTGGALSGALPVVHPAASEFWARGPASIKGLAPSSGGGHAAPLTSNVPPRASAPSVSAASVASAPLTANGKHRWPKQTKAQQRQEQAQKQAFESFANALLHSTSPFMEPLRALCHSSLPHLKIDQRFGKRGAPHTAVSQFIVAPLVVNYRPRHFHELSPGDLMEFHYDFAQVLKRISTANCIAVNYGSDWKPFAVPFCYLGCRDYKAEVAKLCPHEVPNSRSEAVYEDDIVKDITDLVLAIEELEPLHKFSVVQCMSKRMNLSAMYEAFETIFEPIGNYQIQMRDLHKTPSTFLIKTSQQVLDLLPEKGATGIVLHGDPELWYALPEVDNTFQSGKSRLVAATSSGSGDAVEVVASGAAAEKQQHGLAVSSATSTSGATEASSTRPATAPVATTAQQQTSVKSAAAASVTTTTAASSCPKEPPTPNITGGTSSSTSSSGAGLSSQDYALIAVCVTAVAATSLIVYRLLK